MVYAREHNLLPGLTGGWAEQNQHGPAKGLEIVIPVDVGVIVKSYTAEYLHPDHPIDEEDESDEKGDPGQSLKWLEEGPQQSPDAFIFV